MTSVINPPVRPTPREATIPARGPGLVATGLGTLRSLLPGLILMVGIGGFLALKWSKKPPEREIAAAIIPEVETVALQEVPGTFRIQVNGTVTPRREISLTSEVSGRILEKGDGCRAGRFVQQGELLFQLDRQTYELEVKRLEAELKQVEVDIVQLDIEHTNVEDLIKISQNELELKQKELRRQQELARSRIASDSDVDQANSALMQTKNQLQSVENSRRLLKAKADRFAAQQQLIQAKLAQAKLDLARTELRAPIAGIISEEMVEEDAFVQPGSVMARIQDTESMEVRCSLRVEDLYWLWASIKAEPQAKPEEEAARQPLRRADRIPAGETQQQVVAAHQWRQSTTAAESVATSGDNQWTAAWLIPDRKQNPYEIPLTRALVTYRLAGKDYTWQGYLSRYEGIGLDERTRLVPCRVEVPNPAQQVTPGGPPALLRGMFVTVDLEVNPQMKLLRIPQVALKPGNEVWTVRDAKLHIQKVRIARFVDNDVLIRAEGNDLQGNEPVVVSPLGFAYDGLPVRIKNTVAAPAQ